MTRSELEAFEFWQTSCEGIAERKLDDLTNAVDDLTTLAKSRAGAHVLLARRQEFMECLKKMHDLALDIKPVEQVA